MSKHPMSRRPNELLRQERLLRGWTQQDLAGRIETDGYTVNRWERGRALPSPYFRQRLCALFGKNAQDLGLLGTPMSAVSPLPAYWQVPSHRNPFFTGRQQTLEQLHHLLCQPQAAARTPSYALSGLAGIGKTQTAVEYAYRYAGAYAAVFWMEAETAHTIAASLVSMAHCLDLPQHQERDQSKLVLAVNSWLNTHGDWLLLLDNVADIELVKRALPAARGGSLLFTTRLHTLGTLAQSLLLEPLSVEEGRHLLLRRAGYGGPDTAEERLAPEEEAACSALVLALDGVPLALDQAGAYLAQTHTSVSAFLHLFQRDPCQLLGAREAHADHPVSVVHTFTGAFERLQQANPAAAELLSLCCFLAPGAIPEALLTEQPAHLGPALAAVVAHPLPFNALCQDLLASGLLRRDGQTHTLTIPALVGAILKRSMPEESQQEWAQRALSLLTQAFPQGECVTRAPWDLAQCWPGSPCWHRR